MNHKGSDHSERGPAHGYDSASMGRVYGPALAGDDTIATTREQVAEAERGAVSRTVCRHSQASASAVHRTDRSRPHRRYVSNHSTVRAPVPTAVVRGLLDPNVLISGILFRGTPRGLIERAIRGEVDLVISPALLEELEEILVRKFELPSQTALATRTELESLAEVVIPIDVPAVTRDPDDDQVLAAAVSGSVDALVTGDQDLLVIGTHEGIPILSPSDLLARLERD